MKNASKRWRATGIRRCWLNERGTTTLEYALMLALIVGAVVLSYQSLGFAVDAEVSTGHAAISEMSAPQAGPTDSAGGERGTQPSDGAQGRGWGRPDSPADARARGRGQGL
ncbi:MAG: Flp family type IVb pilin [Armatimonadota bacterium]|jgi:Flp pilus assembly pilin Flp